MKVVINRITSWKEVLNAARFTQRKEPLDKEPSEDFKRKMIKAEHSPLRCLMFAIDCYDIPYYVHVHFVRHIHAQPFASTSRPDIDGNQLPREKQKKTDLVNMRLFLNAQEIINISKVRLCNKAEKETKKAWQEVIRELEKIEPILAKACVPSCIYRRLCPEFNSCGFYGTKGYIDIVKQYVFNLDTNETNKQP